MTDPTPDAAAVDAMVAAYRATSGYDGPVGSYAFADTPQLQDELGHLVLTGPKRATAGWHDDEDEPTPVVGQHDVVLDGSGMPLCIVRTEEVRVLPFGQRDPAFAWDEGEGDRTLATWTADHRAYFERYVEGFDDDTLVNFERFVVVHPQAGPPPPLVDADGVVVRAVLPGERAWVATVVRDTTSDEGWEVARCPALLARRDGQTAGVLVFVPSPQGVEVVATALLDDTPAVEAGLRAGLERLRAEHGWGRADA